MSFDTPPDDLDLDTDVEELEAALDAADETLREMAQATADDHYGSAAKRAGLKEAGYAYRRTIYRELGLNDR